MKITISRLRCRSIIRHKIETNFFKNASTWSFLISIIFSFGCFFAFACFNCNGKNNRNKLFHIHQTIVYSRSVTWNVREFAREIKVQSTAVDFTCIQWFNILLVFLRSEKKWNEKRYCEWNLKFTTSLRWCGSHILCVVCASAIFILTISLSHNFFFLFFFEWMRTTSTKRRIIWSCCYIEYYVTCKLIPISKANRVLRYI